MAIDTHAQVLALDTSGSFCSIALRTREGTMLHRESDGAGDHFERISELVSDLLRAGDATVSGLDHIRIGIGPGSFTGLRIGMSFAKGMSAAAKVPLLGVSSFAGLARVVSSGEWSGLGHILVVADARREEVFLAEYAVKDGTLSELVSPRIEGADGVQAWTSIHPDGVVVTPNVGFQLPGGVQPQLESRGAVGLLLLEGQLREPFSLGKLADLEPNYLRAVAAKSIEERKKP